MLFFKCDGAGCPTHENKNIQDDRNSEVKWKVLIYQCSTLHRKMSNIAADIV